MRLQNQIMILENHYTNLGLTNSKICGGSLGFSVIDTQIWGASWRTSARTPNLDLFTASTGEPTILTQGYNARMQSWLATNPWYGVILWIILYVSDYYLTI